jgi:hypothetical protein
MTAPNANFVETATLKLGVSSRKTVSHPETRISDLSANSQLSEIRGFSGFEHRNRFPHSNAKFRTWRPDRKRGSAVQNPIPSDPRDFTTPAIPEETSFEPRNSIP